ncbi:MAG: hypothetical protein E5V25_01840 [Mesorhizobium sp.]|uniref:hypothetical protein n=1 Tax=unclassified Mesorhizobium TaxID=325217 RepID=UPI0007EC88C4|nr:MULTISPECIES: hypothetical protein [unclassified Mesorhizobium]RWB29394.1 MAG: hypothetical protein EOQ43_19565 [Mesorhizobium sp.]RWB61008.1 MAG: hypothetical protein EOQ42_20365 [Mesorhizobium sp.]RWC18299.1 MAG: hypothetical protein EOS51_17155 [Mesorhizobium sp.]RWC31004.1 MAG: hypothetical protein EOS70_20915 [Mesorhizobium sp.]RWD19211.1 MAG: hypothetical protein EOS57_13550 [Mesorhizobium sp.]
MADTWWRTGWHAIGLTAKAYDTEDLTNGPKKPMIRVIRFWPGPRMAMSKPSGKDDPSGIANFHAKRAIP